MYFGILNWTIVNRFFSKKRFQNMSNDKSGKYFIYAIGEIFLVMVGILLALQVNNWNEKRKDRRLEQKYLQVHLLNSNCTITG
jgi:hypothetical protein